MMRRCSYIAQIAVAVLILSGSTAFARGVRLGGISVGAGYGYFPTFWPAYGYGGPFYPGYYGGFAYRPNMGEVKLHVDAQKADVFVDGAFAGTANERKSMWLAPGAYELEVRSPNRASYSRRIYVLSGKTLKIDATLEPENRP